MTGDKTFSLLYARAALSTHMNKLTTAVSSKIVLFNVLVTLLEIAAVADGLLPQKYLIYSTTAKSVLTVILRVWFPSNDPTVKLQTLKDELHESN